MNSLELFRSGKLNDAVQALGAELRSNPLDAKRRTFLFELLCFSGDYDRAEKHLAVLAPMTSTHPDEEVRLGRTTVFEADSEYGEVPFGQKMLAVDDEEVPILEIRKLTFDVASGESRAAAAS